MQLTHSPDVPLRRTSVLPRLLAVAAIALPALGLHAAGAAAADAPAYGVSDFLGTVLRAPTDQDGPSGPHYADLAGEHPDSAVVDFSIRPQDPSDEDSEPSGVTKDVRVDIPPGLVPNPAAFPTCTNEQLDMQAIADDGIGNSDGPNGTIGKLAQQCPVGSQVGFVNLTVRGDIPALSQILPGSGPRYTVNTQLPVYNMTRSADQVGRFAFLPAGAPAAPLLEGDKSRVDIVGSVRPSDNGLYFTIHPPTSLPLLRSKLTFWGTPGLAIHDAERGRTVTDIPFLHNPFDSPTDGKDASNLDRTSTFLTNPTLCGGQLRTTVHVTDVDGQTGDAFSDTPYGAQDCGAVPFKPTVSFDSDQPVQADSPTALNVTIGVPQSTGTDVRGSAQVNNASVTLPQGFSISPSAASSIATCTDDQFAQGTDNPVTCPDAAKVGTVSIDSPLVDSPLQGSVYLGQSLPGDRYRLFVVADGHGVSIRLKGSVKPDATTGRLTALFSGAPQLPFSKLQLSFAGGPKAIIASPTTCGTATGGADLVPYSSQDATHVDASIDVVGCGAGGFSPDFAASVTNGASGKYAPASFQFTRPDNQSTLSGLQITLPAGMTAKVKGVTHCSAAQITAQACPESSRIGTVAVTAGPGADPFPLTGSVYLTDGYKGGAFGSVAIIHAIAGPYDLGNVVVRQALRIDPTTAQITIDSDPLPQIVEGIPLRLRGLRLDVNRTNFLRNPTSCGPADVVSTLTPLAGAGSQKAGRLAFTGCQSLPFRPKLAVALGEKNEISRGRHPKLTATITQNESEAGIKSAQVALPTTLALAADNAKALCDTAVAAAGKCPAASIVGSATATTTILDRPLTGPVYFVKGQRTTAAGKVVATLPTLRVELRGQAAITLNATTSVSHGRLVTTFPAIPDQPLSKFVLNINGGSHGIIALTSDLCSSGRIAASGRFGGYNGKTAPTRKPVISTVCKTAKKTATR